MGGFFAGLAGGLASGFGERRERQAGIDKEDRARRTAAYTHILDSPTATPEAREYAFNQIVSIGEGTDGKKNAKPSPVMQMLQPLLDKIHHGSGGGAQPQQPAPGAPAQPAFVQPPAGSEGDQTVPGMIGMSRGMVDGSAFPPVPGSAQAQSPPPQSAAPAPASPQQLPPVPGSQGAKAARPSRMFLTADEVAAIDNKKYIDRQKGIKQGELDIALDAIPKKIAAAEQASGKKLSPQEKQVLINAEFGIHGYGRSQILRDVDGEQYGQPGQVGLVVRNPVDGTEEFVPTKPKPTAAAQAQDRLITQYMTTNNVDRPTAEKAVAAAAVKKNEGLADAAGLRPTVQKAAVANLTARTAKTQQDTQAVFANIERDKNTKLSQITSDYSKRRIAVQGGKLSPDAKTAKLADLNSEEASQRQLAEDSYQRRVATTTATAQKTTPKQATADPNTPPASLVPPGKIVTFKNGSKWQNINGVVTPVK